MEKLTLTESNTLSTSSELATSLRWIALMSRRAQCDLVASTGIHDGVGLIKQLLAGAKAVQVVSSLYRNGSGQLAVMARELSKWMDRHGYKTIADFRGKLSQAESGDPAAYERVQFMKHFG